MAASIKIQAQAMQEQGIMSIFGSETERNRVFAATSDTTDSPRLRRTLSADLSSKKWLSQNGFTPMKRISSSEDLSLPFEEEKKEVESSEAVWSSIQRDKNKKDQDSIWSCILSNKTNDADDSSKCLPPPYVHPLVKRSQSSLSEKSLEICTESLGSETGSDVVTSYPPSETEEEEHDQQENKVKVQAFAENDDEKQDKDEEVEEEICNVQKYNSLSSSTKKSFPPRSFPPPIPSIHMLSRRDEGRLVLEAVSLPSNNNFSAQRQDGRLVLTFANQQHSKNEETEETEEEEEAEQTTMVTSNGNNVTSVTLMMNNKPNSNINNGNWSEKLKNHVVKVEDVNDVVKKPRVARLISTSPNASFNVYEYFWRSKPNHEQNYKSSSSCSLNNSSNKLIVSGMKNADLVVLRGKNGGYLVHNLKTCKDSRRSYLFWEPYCIATS